MAQKARQQEGADILGAALDYAARGWSIIPVRCDEGGKRPAVKWRRFQSVPATGGMLRRWFGRHPDWQVAVVCGAVSGALVCRDFDEPDAYGAWAEKHPDLSAVLPTVRTGRGWHVYFRAADLRFRKLDDGEYRGERHYAVLPPSVHPSGTRYEWTVPLPDGPVQVIDPVEAGLLPAQPTPADPTEHPTAPPPPASVPGEGVWPPPGLTQRTMRFLHEGADEGYRNAELFCAACDMASKAIGPQDADNRLLEGCQRCRPPLCGPEARATIRSAYSRPRWQVRTASDPFGAYRLPRCMAQHSDLTSSDKIVWAALDYRQRDKSSCFPALEKIAEDVGICRDTAAQSVKRLEAQGLLTIARTWRKANRYTTHLPRLDAAEKPVTKYQKEGEAGEGQATA